VRRAQLREDLAAGQLLERSSAAAVAREARHVEVEPARAADHRIAVAGAAAVGVQLGHAEAGARMEVAVEEREAALEALDVDRTARRCRAVRPAGSAGLLAKVVVI
jgi:hypothetical protein